MISRRPIRTPIARVAAVCLAASILRAGPGRPPSAAAAPASPAGAYALVRGKRMYYEVYGAGPPLVLLHGGGNTIRGSFAHQIPVFARSFRVIGIEQFGHGHSDDVDGEFSYRRMAADTADLLRQLHVEHADIVGWSDGGIIGLILAVRHPELVRRLVISGANISPDGLEPDPAASTPVRPAATTGVASGLDRAALRQRKLERLWRTAPTPADIEAQQLTHIRAPTLVLAGEDDVVRPEHTRMIARLIPHSRLCILPHTSHATFSSRPDLVNPLILRFLQDPAPTR